MKNKILVAIIGTLMLTSCGTYQGAGAAYGTMGGALVGGSIGGIVGGWRGHDVGTLVGAAVGAIGGAAVGAEQDRRLQEANNTTTQVIVYNESASQAETDKKEVVVPEKPKAQQVFYGSFKDEQSGLTYNRLNKDGEIAFGSNEGNIARSSAGALSAMADYLLTVTNEVYIYGSCDSTEENATELSRKRASNVATYFANRGIDRDRLHVIALGNDSPITNDDSEQGRAINRSAEVYITTL